MGRSRLVSSTVGAAVAVAVLVGSRGASADEVQPTGKGIAGGALLGAEVVILGEAAIGARSAWWYALGLAAGGGGGGYLGWRIEQGGDGKTSLYMLAGGMALVIPTTVAMLQATSYHPPDDYTEDRPSTAFPDADPVRATPGAVPAAAPPAPTSSLHMHWSSPSRPVALGLVDVASTGALSLSVPAVEVRPLYTQVEQQQFGVAQAAEVRMPVVAGTF